MSLASWASDSRVPELTRRSKYREQLALLVLLCCLVCLAVMSVATWITSYDFVTGISTDNLSLTASLYAQELLSTLSIFQTTVHALSTRVNIQNALARYNRGNVTAANWALSISDYSSALVDAGSASTTLQLRVVSKNGTGVDGPYGLVNVTNSEIGPIQLPGTHANGTPIFLGDADGGYPPALYPNLTFQSVPQNSTFNRAIAYFNGEPLSLSGILFLGPWQLNETFSLCSMTLPIINNTSAIDVLGWLTVVLSAADFYTLEDSTQGLGNTGVILIAGPYTQNNKFGSHVLYNDPPQISNVGSVPFHYVIPPLMEESRSLRHDGAQITSNVSYPMSSYPAIKQAFTKNNSAEDNGGANLNTNNEEGDQVSVGFALVESDLVDWAIIIEQDYSEVIQPVTRLRNVIIACLFGTLGLVIIFLFPIAHYSVRPIVRLREATLKSVDPYNYPSESGERSRHSSLSSRGSGMRDVQGDEEAAAAAALARKEGMMTRITKWRPTMRRKKGGGDGEDERQGFRIPKKVLDRKHLVKDELTDLTTTFNEMTEELMMQYQRLEERVRERTAELELSKVAAEAANESKTLFIANISHELKTPLNGIMGMCAVCMHEDDPTKIKRSLGIIYKSGDLLLNLLTDLLTFSKNQMGQQLNLDEKEFRLADVSSQILSIFDKQAKEASIHLGVTFEGPNESLDTASGNPGQPGYGPFGTGRVKDMFLWGDQHRILQVVINLVSNSLKFTPPGGSVTVRIKCVGDFDQEKAPSSRKGSSYSRASRTASRTSRDSRQLTIQNGPRSSRARGRNISGSESSLAGSKEDTGRGTPHHRARDRSLSPPLLNARTLIFEFEVEDTGPGIPPAQQKKVFEPFVQGDLGLSKKYGGTGLGLSICSQLATLMKGTINLQSVEGQGSTFTMRIPLKFIKERADSTASSSVHGSHRNSLNHDPSQPHTPHTPKRAGSDSDLSVHSAPPPGATLGAAFDQPASKPRLVGLSQPFFATSPPLETPKAQLEAMERVAAEATRSGGKVRVLVAEDNKVNQEVVLRMLKLEEIYDVTVAKDGQEAFDLVKESMAQKNFYSLIFMDVQMPNLDGLQSTRLIREMGYSAPIVALTAFAEESNVQECMDSGMDFFLPKPIRRPALKQVLKRYCATIPEAVEEPDSPPPQQQQQPSGSSRPKSPLSPTSSNPIHRTKSEGRPGGGFSSRSNSPVTRMLNSNRDDGSGSGGGSNGSPATNGSTSTSVASGGNGNSYSNSNGDGNSNGAMDSNNNNNNDNHINNTSRSAPPPPAPSTTFPEFKPTSIAIPGRTSSSNTASAESAFSGSGGSTLPTSAGSSMPPTSVGSNTMPTLSILGGGVGGAGGGGDTSTKQATGTSSSGGGGGGEGLSPLSRE